MKKLLSLLTITTLATSVPAPLLANTVQTRTKRDVGTTEKDVTDGLQIKMENGKNLNFNWKLISKTIGGREIEKKYDKWYFFIVPYNYIPNNVVKFNSKWDVLTLGGNIKFNGYYFPFKHVKKMYRWDGVGEPNLPEINSSTGEITDWKDSSLFQKGISFSLADGSKTATWSNVGMRLTVDGETNININNPNVEEVYWDSAKQNMLEYKVNINVKSSTSEKTHKLVIKYNINGTKYTSEDIDVVVAAKINQPSPIVPKQLSELINNTTLGNITNNNDDTIKAKIIKNNSLDIDFSQIAIEKKDMHSATLKARDVSRSYQGSVVVIYNVVPATVVDLKIYLTSLASGVQIDKDYLAQLGKSKMTNKVDTFYYANGKSVIKIKQPPTGNNITGVVYGCDEQWNKTAQSSTIDQTNGLEIDKGQYGSVDGRYLVELQHKDLPTHTKTIYLQVSDKQKVPHYFDTDNGKQFEQWAEDNGYKNIRGSSASQLNNLFELSKTWKQSLAHLDLKLDNFVVYNIQNVTQDEIDTYKTKLLASVKAQVEKYVPDVVENIDYAINANNLVAGDWTTGKDVKIQAVDDSTKLLSFTTKTIPTQIKHQPTTPESTLNNDKKGLTGWAIVGIIVGSLSGLLLLGWLLKKFVITPFICEPIRKKKAKAFAEKTAKDIAQMKADEADEEAKRKGEK
ncbi:spiroplasma phage ORF1-like family protein [Spiroplasma endosymbiont of Polydrusus cervinus]|uniref:spiroplasma phage ORF1-like family protein n=1 Tax=Spiroplasma endosymbiont of Polydrusus cervinus TaxID=3066287 RepID=UPI0030CCD8A4